MLRDVLAKPEASGDASRRPLRTQNQEGLRGIYLSQARSLVCLNQERRHGLADSAAVDFACLVHTVPVRRPALLV